MMHLDPFESPRSSGPIVPWNKGRLVGPKPPLKLRDIWGIRVRLQLANQIRDLALFNLAIDSKLRGCDLVQLTVQDVAHGGRVLSRTAIVQQKTGRPVQFELTEQTRTSIQVWITTVALRANDYLFPSRLSGSQHLSTWQYARIVKSWVESIGLDPLEYGTHSMRRTKAALIYRRTRNLRAVQLLLGIRSWKARCAISASRSMTHSRCRSRQRYEKR